MKNRFAKELLIAAGLCAVAVGVFELRGVEVKKIPVIASFAQGPPVALSLDSGEEFTMPSTVAHFDAVSHRILATNVSTGEWIVRAKGTNGFYSVSSTYPNRLYVGVIVVGVLMLFGGLVLCRTKKAEQDAAPQIRPRR